MNKQGHCIQDKRIKLPKGRQKELIELLKNITKLSWPRLGALFDVSEQTIKIDWRSEKSTLPWKYYLIMLKKVPAQMRNKFCKDSHVLKENWGQSKGGYATVRKVRPHNYIRTIDNIRTSPELAELIGITLGDGHLETKSLRVTLEYPYELPYANYVSYLIQKVAGISPRIYSYPENHEIRVVLNSIDFVRALQRLGMKVGDKVENNVGIPSFIKENRKLLPFCIRGLIDTDGGFFAKDTKRNRMLMEFSSRTERLRADVKKSLQRLGFSVSYSGRIGIRVQNQNDVKKLINVIGTKNPKAVQKLEVFERERRMPLSKELRSSSFNAPVIQPG